MPIDPTGGRVEAPAEAAPYRNALTITPDDDRDLPVIPNAFYFPAMISARWSDEIGTDGGVIVDQAGEIMDNAEGDPVSVMNECPWAWGCGDRPAEIAMILQNGEAITVNAPSAWDRRGQMLILPLRPRRIMRTGTTVHRIVLLW